mmetsp:Transcript_98687/g.282118  ORF Transcript_98687/g.282118 Transcript_98687/m.282118 type:complete len:601 (+) Transcript_98687:659-2461(+)
MLDHVSVFSKSGVVLWQKSMAKLKPVVGGSSKGMNVVDALISNTLLEEKGGSDRSAEIDSYMLRWTLANELELVFVVIYQKLIPLLYIEDLLEGMKAQFVKLFAAEIKAMNASTYPLPFDEPFEKCLRKAQRKALDVKKEVASKRSLVTPPSPNRRKGQPTPDEDDVGEGEGDDDEAAAGGEQAEFKNMMSARAALAERAASGGGGKRRPKKTSSKEGTGGDGDEGGKNGKKVKKMTQWHDGTAKKLTKKQKEALNRSAKDFDGNEDDAQLAEYQAKFLPEAGEVAEWEEEEPDLEDEDEEDEDDEGGEGGEAKGWFGKSAVGSFLKDSLDSATGNKVLTAEELAPVLDAMRQQLISKNVASEIALNITETVKATLVGQKLASFTRVKTMVTQALKSAVMRVLTPKKSTDILHEIISNRRSGKPYTIVFVGINGVGKSTSLAKVCYYLKQHNIKVMIAACDTFRSGAVEQLRSHARCLDVPLFEKGYLKDPGEVAKAAIDEGTANGFDVVLVDTAGRMQNNDKLMRELAKLVQINDPNLLLFVGEALVGNDGIDQLLMFNKALQTYIPRAQAHEVDGIVLTKFDTIDDKVGGLRARVGSG